MTPQEAINNLNDLRQYYNDKNEDGYVGFDDEDNEAIDMAIKTLEQQTCDCISIAKALEMLGDEPENWTDTEKEIQEVNDYRWFKSILEELPPVTPQPKRGEWKYIEYIESSEGEGHTYGECGKCHKIRIIDNYCPNCGSYNGGGKE